MYKYECFRDASKLSSTSTQIDQINLKYLLYFSALIYYDLFQWKILQLTLLRGCINNVIWTDNFNL